MAKKLAIGSIILLVLVAGGLAGLVRTAITGDAVRAALADQIGERARVEICASVEAAVPGAAGLVKSEISPGGLRLDATRLGKAQA